MQKGVVNYAPRPMLPLSTGSCGGISSSIGDTTGGTTLSVGELAGRAAIGGSLCGGGEVDGRATAIDCGDVDTTLSVIGCELDDIGLLCVVPSSNTELSRARDREPNHEVDFGRDKTLGGEVLGVVVSAAAGTGAMLEGVSTGIGVLGRVGDSCGTGAAAMLRFESGELRTSEPAEP